MADKTVNWTTMNQAKMITLEAKVQKRQNERRQQERQQERKAKTNKTGIPVSFAYLDAASDGERLAPKLAKGAKVTNVLVKPNIH